MVDGGKELQRFALSFEKYLFVMVYIAICDLTE